MDHMHTLVPGMEPPTEDSLPPEDADNDTAEDAHTPDSSSNGPPALPPKTRVRNGEVVNGGGAGSSHHHASGDPPTVPPRRKDKRAQQLSASPAVSYLEASVFMLH